MSNRFIDRLESRLCFAAGPTVTSQLFVGRDDAVTSLVIGFSGPLDPTTATNPDNFLFGGSRGNGRKVHKTPFLAPVYNDADRTVTLVFEKDFPITRFKRLKVIIYSEKVGELADPAGNLLDGDRDGEAGGDSDSRYKIKRGKKLEYKDADGDRVTLRTRGAEGRPMTTLIGPNRDVVQVWVSGANNRLTGELKVHKQSAGVTPIGRVVLEDPTNTTELVSPSPFNVGQTVSDAQSAVPPGIVTLF